MNTSGARVLITDSTQGRVWEEYVRDPEEDADTVYQAMKDTLDPVVRRTPKARYEAMLKRILEDAITSYSKTGRASWPASVQRVFQELAVDDPTILNEGGIEQVIRQGKALARHVVETGENQQRAQDRKRTTLGWSGLY